MKKLQDYKTVWVDLTDIIDWTGHFTGIQKVEYELASRLAQKKNVRFFVYHPIKSSFLEASFDIIQEKAKVASGEKELSKKELDKQLRFSKRLSVKFKEAIPYNTRMRLVKVKGQLQRMNERSPLEPLHPFSADDLVIVPGGTWAFGTYMPALAKVKRSVPGLKTVHVLYDFIPIVQPGFFPKEMNASFKKYIKYVLREADFSLSISENTKQDALAFAKTQHIKPKAIETFRLGDDFTKIQSQKPRKLEAIRKGEFILCVGTFEIRKNYQLLYYVMKLAKKKGITLPKIIIVGKVGWLADTTLHLLKNDPDTKDGFMLYPWSDKEKAWLFENCLFTVYPSLYEGWGLPVAESLLYGKMSLSSDVSSLPEVGGGLVAYFSPYDAGECLAVIERYLDPKVLRAAEKKISQKYKATTWDETYKQVLSLIESNL